MDGILRNILNGKLRMVRNKIAETDSEDDDDDDDYVEDHKQIPEDAGKNNDTTERGGRFFPIRTNTKTASRKYIWMEKSHRVRKLL